MDGVDVVATGGSIRVYVYMLRVPRQLRRTPLPATMIFLEFILLSTLGYAALSSPASTTTSQLGKECKILFDGRVPQRMTPPDFDKNSSIFDHQFVHGQSESFVEC